MQAEIHLHVEPGISKDWRAFQREAPLCSIALDGYVIGPPAFADAGPHANFDHHVEVDRLATRSTCMQVFLAIMVGLYDAFSKEGRPFAHVFVNDADQDTCLAIWLLRHPARVRSMRLGQAITSLLLAEDLLDCTGGAYPAGSDRPLMREQAWVFDPYLRARTQGRLAAMDSTAMEALIEDVCTRIDRSAAGTHEQIDIDTRYEDIGGGLGWRMIVEHGPHARTSLFASGVSAFVSVLERPDGRWTYTIGRMSPFVAFPMERAYAELNEAEGTKPGPQGWGGSNTIGGSPRGTGSRLSPADVERVVNRATAGDARV